MAFCGKYGKQYLAKCIECYRGKGAKCPHRYSLPYFEISLLILLAAAFIYFIVHIVLVKLDVGGAF